MGNLVHTNQPLLVRPHVQRQACMAGLLARALPEREPARRLARRRRLRRRHSPPPKAHSCVAAATLAHPPARPPEWSGGAIAVGGFFVTQKCLY